MLCGPRQGRRVSQQHSICRLAGSWQLQCSSRRNFARFTSAGTDRYDSERDRGGEWVGGWVDAKYVVRRQKTQTVLNENFYVHYDTERAPGCCPWESLDLAALGSPSISWRVLLFALAADWWLARKHSTKNQKLTS